MGWRYTLSDETTHDAIAADQAEAWMEAEDAAGPERAVLILQRVESEAPTVIRSASGSTVVLDVGEGGAVVATPVESSA